MASPSSHSSIYWSAPPTPLPSSLSSHGAFEKELEEIFELVSYRTNLDRRRLARKLQAQIAAGTLTNSPIDYRSSSLCLEPLDETTTTRLKFSFAIIYSTAGAEWLARVPRCEPYPESASDSTTNLNLRNDLNTILDGLIYANTTHYKHRREARAACRATAYGSDSARRREARKAHQASVYGMSTTNTSNSNMFPGLETRQAPSSPASSHAGGQMNGNGIAAAGYMPPLPAGHQQDLNYLHNQMQELSAILKNNRERVNGITRTAEEVAKRANGGRVGGDGSKENDAARIHELEQALATAHRTIDLYKDEQTKNTKLIAEYEDAMGTATDQIRTYCCDNNERYLAQRRHYNNLLQAEKDEHLQSRLDKDHWQAQTIKVCGMIRHAYRLRCEEWGEELGIISGLQNEVRVLRSALGMEKERPEEETGWPYLKEAPLNLEGIEET